MKIAIIGNLDTIKGFKLLGIDVFGIDSIEQAKEVLFSVYSSHENYALIFLTENWFIQLRNEIKQFEERSLPAIIAIPSVESKKSITGEELSRIIERAIGSDILSK